MGLNSDELCVEREKSRMTFKYLACAIRVEVGDISETGQHF